MSLIAILSTTPCAGPKAHPIIIAILHSRQQTLLLHDLRLEVLTVNGNELRLFGAKAFPPTRTINVVHLTFKVFYYDEVWSEYRASGNRLTEAEHQTHYLPAPSYKLIELLVMPRVIKKVSYLLYIE